MGSQKRKSEVLSEKGVNIIHLQSFNAYLKASWMKPLISSVYGDWDKLILFNHQICGGERIMIFENENQRKIAMILTNPF